MIPLSLLGKGKRLKAQCCALAESLTVDGCRKALFIGPEKTYLLETMDKIPQRGQVRAIHSDSIIWNNMVIPVGEVDSMKRFSSCAFYFLYAAEPLPVPLVSLSVKSADRRSLSFPGFHEWKNIVFPEAPYGELSLTLHDVPYEEALRLAAASQGLFLETVGDVTIVAPAGTMERGFGALTAYPLSYVPAKEAAETLKPLIKAPLSFDQTSNTLLCWEVLEIKRGPKRSLPAWTGCKNR